MPCSCLIIYDKIFVTDRILPLITNLNTLINGAKKREFSDNKQYELLADGDTERTLSIKLTLASFRMLQQPELHKL